MTVMVLSSTTATGSRPESDYADIVLHVTARTVVVTGIDSEGVVILDPAQGADPIQLSENEFLTAWLEMDCIFAFVT